MIQVRCMRERCCAPACFTAINPVVFSGLRSDDLRFFVGVTGGPVVSGGTAWQRQRNLRALSWTLCRISSEAPCVNKKST